jgi:hypothetical protein
MMSVWILEITIWYFTVTVTVTGNLLNTKALTLVSRLLSQPVQSRKQLEFARDRDVTVTEYYFGRLAAWICDRDSDLEACLTVTVMVTAKARSLARSRLIYLNTSYRKAPALLPPSCPDYYASPPTKGGSARP